MRESTVGESIQDVLFEIENLIIERDAANPTPPIYPDAALRSSLKILMSVIMDRMWKLQEAESIDFQTRCNMAQKCGEEMRQLIKTYTGIDSFDMYKEKERVCVN